GGDEALVAAYQPARPDADGEVGRHVGLAAGVLDGPSYGPQRPGAVAPLGTAYPGPGAVDRFVSPGQEQRHRGLDVVPDVGVTADGPRDRAVALLDDLDRGAGPGDL